jgi:hypothetical protein
MHTNIAYNFCLTIFDEQYVCQMAGSGEPAGRVAGSYPFDFYPVIFFAGLLKG